MRQLLLACCIAPVLASLATAPATAHAILMESKPPAQAILSPGSTRFMLRFNSRIDQARSRLELRRADAKLGELALPPLVVQPAPPDTLVADLPLSIGTWVLRWQVLAVDGHITRGEVPFTVRTP